jgi:hypothetical protein
MREAMIGIPSTPSSRVGSWRAHRAGTPRRTRGTLRRQALAIALAGIAALALGPIAAASSAATISGTVEDGAHAPLQGIEVTTYERFEAFGGEFFPAFTATTDGTGKYRIEGLPAGSYRVSFAAAFASGLNFVDQFFEGKSHFSEATAVEIATAGQVVTANAQLHEGATISGTVAGEGAGSLGEVLVVAAPVGEGESFAEVSAETASNGSYTLTGLAPGASYTLQFLPPSSVNFVAQFFDGRPLRAQAEPVVIGLEGSTRTIDATLQTGGGISGTVTDAATHAPVAKALVDAFDPDEPEAGGFTTTNANGEYNIVGLPSGTYDLEVGTFSGLGGGIEYLPLQRAGVGVTRGSIHSGLDVSLTRAAPVNTSAPVIAGTPVVGGPALTCSTGGWTGRATLKYTYQWTRDGSPIANATAGSYVAQGADQGHALVCQVTATNGSGRATAASNTLTVPGAPQTRPLPALVAAPKPATTLKLGAARAITVRGGVARLRIGCKAARCAGTLQLLQQVVTKTHKGGRTIVHRSTIGLASGVYSLAGGRSGVVALRLSAAGRRRLAHARGHKLLATFVLTVKGGKTTRQAVFVVQAVAQRKR